MRPLRSSACRIHDAVIVEETYSRRKAFGAGRSDRMKTAAQACDTARGCSPARRSDDVEPEQWFSGVRSGFSQ
jgi:hypothetical protein